MNIINKLMKLPRHQKSLLMVLADVLVLPAALYSAFMLRFADLWPVEYLDDAMWMFVWVAVAGPLLLLKFGLYRAVVRYIGWTALNAIAKGVLTLVMSVYVVAWFIVPEQLPRSVPLIFGLVALLYVGGTRAIVRQYYRAAINRSLERTPVLIYGAGEAGMELMRALQASQRFRVVAFIDDDRRKWKTSIQGISVCPPERLQSYISAHDIDRVLLAVPSATHNQRKRILEYLAQYPVLVQTMPSMSDLASGKTQIDTLKSVDVEDLLGRDPVPPLEGLLTKKITGKAVMVTGAGGSIGSELCRQIVRQQPSCLVLFEQSEYALYAISQELHQADNRVKVISILGSVTDAQRVQEVIARFTIQTIYHAAAYKHVPMVEHNIVEGVRNNVLGTQTVALTAEACGVSDVVLISTDKAVRPTNVMGASKRLAEQVLQALAQKSKSTIFTMVRFGNVLGSSGSVVPVFREQIANGGPITVTHPDITRYFMTIPEAASLVIQAGAMAQGGDVFVLDMGEPVKIVDLAKRMIHLSGFEVRDADHPQGNIEIAFTGLRPGEKLYEELLIDANVLGTNHPKIMRANEGCLSADRLVNVLAQLQTAIDVRDPVRVRDLLQQAVPEFKPVTECVDWVST